MRIKKNKPKNLTFKMLNKGEVFFISGVESPLMKITACKGVSTDCYFNAVTLNTGTLVKVEDANQVDYRPNAYLGFEEDIHL